MTRWLMQMSALSAQQVSIIVGRYLRLSEQSCFISLSKCVTALVSRVAYQIVVVGNLDERHSPAKKRRSITLTSYYLEVNIKYKHVCGVYCCG